MDTNQNNKAENYQINSFTRGMNSDTSYDMIGADQYLFGQNIRITNNTLISNDITSNTTENIISPVYYGKDIHISGQDVNIKVKSILATASIEDVGTIIVKDINDKWHVFRANLKEDEIVLTKVFSSSNETKKDRFSVIINNELSSGENTSDNKAILKLYIADGVNPIMCINLNDEAYYKNANEDWLISNRIYPTNRVKFVSKISGQLKTQQVQYTYRLYKKYGISSKLAPITNKINVIDNNRNKELGNAEDTITSIGFKLSIDGLDEYSKIFDHIQIFRISYIKYGENAEINLIYDAKLSDNSESFSLNDTGIQSLAKYSMDEFSALNSITLKPQIIEQNQNYLFAGNITDDSQFRISFKEYNPRAYQFDKNGYNKYYNADQSDYIEITSSDFSSPNENYYINQSVDINSDEECQFDKDGYYGGTGPNISWRFVTCDIPIDTSDLNSAPDNSQRDTNVNFSYIHRTKGLEKIKDSEDYFKEKGVSATEYVSYNEIFTSSLLRSLKRGEVYRYGIVFYDKYGIRSDVLWIADIRTPSVEEFNMINLYYNSLRGEQLLHARPLGIEFKVNVPEINDRTIVGYQIVRCEKSATYTKNLLQVALSRPSRQGTYEKETYRTPYYPNVYLSTQFFYTAYGFTPDDPFYTNNHRSEDLWEQWFDKNGTNVENNTLYQIFSPEINIARKDQLSTLSSSDIILSPLYYAQELNSLKYTSEKFGKITSNLKNANLMLTSYDVAINNIEGEYDNVSQFHRKSALEDSSKFVHKLEDTVYLTTKYLQNIDSSEKIDKCVVIKPYDIRFVKDCTATINGIKNQILTAESVAIRYVNDVKNPLWNEGFSDIQLSGSDIIGAIKQYKSFNTNVGSKEYVNWVANGMYDMPAYYNEVSTEYGGANTHSFVLWGSKDLPKGDRSSGSYGWIGAGPICFVIDTEEPESNNILSVQVRNVNGPANLGTICANVQHTAVQFAGISAEEKQYDTYYGFGNFGKFYNGTSSIQVFDGDIYIVPAEFVNMFKTYNFNDIKNTIPSGQVVYYIPLESKINTFFDYGMNYKNTSNSNIQLEPGTITGVSSQDRPLHQYNMIYSDNNTSNDVFSSQSLEDNVDTYKQRIYYSQLKTNGEYIDNWQIFKPADFIDTDSRYGQLTELFTVNDIMYFWQNSAFGKLSVNERSLVTDNNSNTIQLGQGGVLQRTDYINTRYGMREQDYSAIAAEGSIYWIDSNNRAVILFREGVVNYCEYTNVQNITNELIDNNYRPNIDYDIQNLEVLCQFLKYRNQLIFSSKLGVGTSIYTRDYESTIQFKNVLYGLKISKYKLYATQYNYLVDCDKFLTPTVLQFVVNSSASQTKVFDNQKVVTLKRYYIEDSAKRYMENKKYSFTTDICGVTELKEITDVTDREGNICYTIPRFDNAEYGNRIRGKWLKVDIVDNNPNKESSISHIITKFRQSYS